MKIFFALLATLTSLSWSMRSLASEEGGRPQVDMAPRQASNSLNRRLFGVGVQLFQTEKMLADEINALEKEYRQADTQTELSNASLGRAIRFLGTLEIQMNQTYSALNLVTQFQEFSTHSPGSDRLNSIQAVTHGYHRDKYTYLLDIQRLPTVNRYLGILKTLRFTQINVVGSLIFLIGDKQQEPKARTFPAVDTRLIYALSFNYLFDGFKAALARLSSESSLALGRRDVNYVSGTTTGIVTFAPNTVSKIKKFETDILEDVLTEVETIRRKPGNWVNPLLANKGSCKALLL